MMMSAKHLSDAAQGNLKDSTVISKDKFIKHESRTSQNCWLEHDANEIVHEVSKRLSILVQMPIRNAEQYQVVYYKKLEQNISRTMIHLIMNTEEGKKKDTGNLADKEC